MRSSNPFPSRPGPHPFSWDQRTKRGVGGKVSHGRPSAERAAAMGVSENPRVHRTVRTGAALLIFGALEFTAGMVITQLGYSI